MSDNTGQTGTDTIRTIDRSSVKTPVGAIDLGGEAGPEKLWVAGTNTIANVPAVSLASDQLASNLNGTLTTSPTDVVTFTVPAGMEGVVLTTGSATWAGTLNITVSYNGTDFYTPDTNTASSLTLTPGGLGLISRINCGGMQAIKVSGTFSSGPVVVTGRFQQAPHRVDISGEQIVVTSGFIAISGNVAETVSDLNATTSITTQNLNPLTGTATTGSTLPAQYANGCTQYAIEVNGTYTAAGGLSIQVSGAGSTWVTNTLASALMNAATGVQSATIASAAVGVFLFNSGGAAFRVSALGAVTGTATVRIVAVRGTTQVGLDSPIPAGTNTIGAVNIAAAQTLATVTTVTTVSTVSNLAAIAAGANLIADVGIGVRATANGLTKTRVTSAATTNATSIKASAGRIYGIKLFNTSAALKYLKLYNKASAPTVGTDTPVFTIPLPIGAWLPDPTPMMGDSFATGIAYAITNLLADSDTTAVAAGDVIGQILTA